MEKIRKATEEERGPFLLPTILYLKIYFIGGREIAHWLRALAALWESCPSLPSAQHSSTYLHAFYQMGEQ